MKAGLVFAYFPWYLRSQTLFVLAHSRLGSLDRSEGYKKKKHTGKNCTRRYALSMVPEENQCFPRAFIFIVVGWFKTPSTLE